MLFGNYSSNSKKRKGTTAMLKEIPAKPTIKSQRT
jgi:hypothetical protein